MNTCRHSPAPACLAQAVSLAACTGVGMALVSPNAQSLIADLYPAAARGRSFGATLMVVCLGAPLSSHGGACDFCMSVEDGVPGLLLRAESAHTEPVPACTWVPTDQEGVGRVHVCALPCHAAVCLTLRMVCGTQHPLQPAHQVAGASQAAWLADSLQSASATGALAHWRCGLGLSCMLSNMCSLPLLLWAMCAAFMQSHSWAGRPSPTRYLPRAAHASSLLALVGLSLARHAWRIAQRPHCRAGSWRTLSWRASARSHARWWCWAWRSRGARRAWACAPRCAGAPVPCCATCGPCCACAGAHMAGGAQGLSAAAVLYLA